MKTMTCKQLGGACDKEFQATTFEEIVEISKNHGMEMREDLDHQKAMQEMIELMGNPDSMKEWMENKKKEFDALSDE
jgi:hypothetical protein